MSRSRFRPLAKKEGIDIRRRSQMPGVNWTSVEQWIARSRLSSDSTT